MEYKIVRKKSELNIDSLLELYFDSERKKENTFKKESDFYHFLCYDFFRNPKAFYCVAEDAGIYVSGFRMGPYEDGWLLSGLQTRMDSRGKGHASSCMRFAFSLLNDREKVYSHVAKRNFW